MCPGPGTPSPAAAKVRSRKSPAVDGATPEYVIIVDPFSTGCCVGLVAFDRGYRIIAVWSKTTPDEVKTHRPQSCERLQYAAEITEAATTAMTAEAAQAIALAGMAPKAAVFVSLEDVAEGEPGKIVACIVGAENGVQLADALSEYMKLHTNGTQIPERRDKKIQQELVKATGLRSVRQAGGTTLAEIEEFLKTEHYPVVVKPVNSAGADGVKLCHSYKEATDHFNLLMHSQTYVGSQVSAVLCQEFLKGKEYIVDHVSRDGVHKTTMVWVYDRRPVNGAAFVCHGAIPVPLDSEEAKVLIPYVRGVLDALQIRFGASHGEVMMTVDGPCLVEMNCRAMGCDGAWMPLAEALTGGYSQVDACVDSFLDEEAFNKLPDVPPCPFLASGQCVSLVSFSKGIVKATPGFEIIKKLDSFVCLETGVREGSEVSCTVDLFSNVGLAILRHHDAVVVQRDQETIRELLTYQRHVEILGRSRVDSKELPLVEDLAAQPQ